MLDQVKQLLKETASFEAKNLDEVEAFRIRL